MLFLRSVDENSSQLFHFIPKTGQRRQEESHWDALSLSRSMKKDHVVSTPRAFQAVLEFSAAPLIFSFLFGERRRAIVAKLMEEKKLFAAG